MKPVNCILALLALTVGPALAQQRAVRGTITFISGDVFYISAGREMGIRDSSRAFLFARTDTVAVLQVIATSSSSSACTVLTAKRRPVVGDTLNIPLETHAATVAEPASTKSVNDSSITSPREVASPLIKQEQPVTKPFATAHGRIGARYLTILPSASSALAITQPGIAFSLRGKINDTPLQFILLGNVRTLIYGSSSPFQSGAINQTRIYRASLDYDDAVYRVSLGRITSTFAPSTGYTDGLLLSRRIGDFLLGASGGYEPSFAQQSVSTDYRKFSLFGGYQPESNSQYTIGVSYGKTYYHSEVDREVASGSVTMFPLRDMYIYAQSEVDLRTKKNDELTTRPKLTNLIANVDYRFSTLFSFGVGVVSARPAYSFAVVRAIPDSLLDMRLQTSPTASINFYFPSGISLYSRFTPRTSDQEFGKEFSHYTSLGLVNALDLGVALRGAYNINSTPTIRTNGYSVTMQKTVPVVGDINARYQFYRYKFLALDETRTSKSIGLDIITPVVQALTCWSSIERTAGLDADATTVSLELSWSF